MVANTDQERRVFSLIADAKKLVKLGNRTPQQIKDLLKALQTFKDAPSAKIKKASLNDFGNRCGNCGGTIDDGGFCACKTDHMAI